MLARYGAEIGDKLLESRRLADASTAMFGAITSMSRANRSYCIGHRNADLEVRVHMLMIFTLFTKVYLNKLYLALS